MEFVFVIAGASLIILFFIYDSIRSHQKIAGYKNNVQALEAEFKKLQEADQSLQQELTTAKNKLQRIAEDPLTGLLGWQLFEDRLNQSLKESARYQLTMGVLFIDIDDFKVINDALGYEIGDGLLREVAQLLQTCIRQVDSMSRFTKDTFVILLTQLSKPETAAVVAQRILQTLSQPLLVKDHELYITACIGISIYPVDGQDVATLLRSAGHALHLAKEKGNHIYQFYQENMHAQSQRELALYTSLSRESIFNEFVLYYQPIVDMQAGKIVCMDALLHWQDSEFGLIKPQELFSLAERQRKVNVISEWLLRQACKQFQQWHSLDFKPALLGVSLSIKQLETSQFIYRFSQIMQELDFKPDCLLLEIKEGATELSFEILEKAFNMLKYMGVKIAIDDFGSGLFSLRHLKNFAINYLKFDPSLVDDINNSDNQQAVALIKALVFLAQSMSMGVIIQGVESTTQIAILKGLGCLLMQGPLLGGPLSEQDVIVKMTSFTS